MYLHQRPDFKELIEITAQEQKIADPYLVEKDYWIMHCLYGLSQLKLKMELKGGTSLSKAYGMIHRFSEDLDIKIVPDKNILGFEVYQGKNHDKPRHRESRKNYFNYLAKDLEGKIDGIESVERDINFDDEKYRSGGIRLQYKTHFNPVEGLKEGILLEVGFDRTSPNEKKTISSWAFDLASAKIPREITDNRAKDIVCYKPKYTFVEKLQAIVTKYDKFKKAGGKNFPENFLRHYYDIYCLLKQNDVQAFIGRTEYEKYKKERFRNYDTVVKNCEGFHLSDSEEKKLFENKYKKSSSLYYRGQVPFSKILERISMYLHKL